MQKKATPRKTANPRQAKPGELREAGVMYWKHPGGKLREEGPESLTDAELLAVLIGTGVKGATAEEIAEELLQRYGSVQAALDRLGADGDLKGVGKVKRARLAAALELARRIKALPSQPEPARADEDPRFVSPPDTSYSPVTAELFPNVQFIYELALAELELEALGAKYEVTNGLRIFKLWGHPDAGHLRRRVAYFQKINDAYTDYYYITRKNRMRSVNQYLTHWIYPYKGKFHPQMIRALFNIIGLQPGDTVLDPFIGSGTTAVEAQLLGVNCIGYDISPLCVIQSRVKTLAYPFCEEIELRKREVLAHTLPAFMVRDADSLSQYTRSIQEERVKEFFLLAELLGRSDEARRGRDFLGSVAKNVDRMLWSLKDQRAVFKELQLPPGKVNIEQADARKLPLKNESVDGIITSPPYSIALDYVENDEHALRALGIDPRSVRDNFVGVRGRGAERLALYTEDMKQSYREMYRVLKPGRFCVIIIGNASFGGEEVKTVEFTIDYCENLGFKLVKNIHKIIFGLYNVMQSEKILIFQKVS